MTSTRETYMMLSWVKIGLAALTPSIAQAQETCQNTDTQICVDREDLRKFLELAKERQCLDQTLPQFQLDPVTIITDHEGRVYYTGNDPDHPYKLHMQWCHYKVDGEGKIKIVAAMNEPPTWGFRFRPKAYLGYLPLKALESDSSYSEGIDAGVMLDFLYYKSLNLDVAAGFRSVGLGLGLDLTTNFGVYAGYAFTWDVTPTPHSVLVNAHFAF